MFAAQPGQFGALGTEFGLQGGAALAGFLHIRFELGYPLLGAPLVAHPGAVQFGDPSAGGTVPAPQKDGAGEGGGRRARGEHPLHQIVADTPRARGAGN